MTSLLSTGTKRRNSPAWCKPGMFSGIDPTPNERPAALNAWISFHYRGSGFDLRGNETMRLRRNQTGDGWSGYNNYGNEQIYLQVLDNPSLTTVTLRLLITLEGLPIADTTWLLIRTDFRKPWGTPLTTDIQDPDNWESSLQVLG